MEYVEGVPIDEYVKKNNVNLEYLFRSTINAFVCLENNNILHRDIRPANIMVDNNGEIKVIDFGFAKILNNNNLDNSILLNWPATEYPNEVVSEKEYTVQTEIYFIGYLFRKLFQQNEITEFKFMNVIEKMCKLDSKDRYISFEDVTGDIAKGILLNLSFNAHEKKIYLELAEYLSLIIISFTNIYSPVTNSNDVLNGLEKLLKSSILEDNIQNNASLVRIFVNNDFSFDNYQKIPINVIENFYELLLNSDLEKRKIILENLRTRLNEIYVVTSIIDISDDDLPF